MAKRRKPKPAPPQQLPVSRMTEHQLAEAGVELAERLTELKHMEDQWADERREYNQDHKKALEKIGNLRGRIEEQKAVLGD